MLTMFSRFEVLVFDCFSFGHQGGMNLLRDHSGHVFGPGQCTLKDLQSNKEAFLIQFLVNEFILVKVFLEGKFLFSFLSTILFLVKMFLERTFLFSFLLKMFFLTESISGRPFLIDFFLTRFLFSDN